MRICEHTQILIWYDNDGVDDVMMVDDGMIMEWQCDNDEDGPSGIIGDG